MKGENCPKCGYPLRLNPGVKLGTRATDYGNCHAFCDVCRIGISNSRNPEQRTYICQSLADNLADPQSEERYLRIMDQALNQRNRQNKIRRARFEKSEDTVTWSIFSHLEGRGSLAIAAQALTGVTWNAPVEALYWGYNDHDSQGVQERLITVLKKLGESARSFSEPDLILYAPQRGLAFVEIKYASANSTRFDQGKAQRYIDGGGDYLKADCANMRYYELLRNWVIGCLLAKELGLPFWLVNLVRRGEETDIERDFGQFLRQDPDHQFRRAEWEELFEALSPALDQPSDDRLWEYIRTRTIYFQKAFTRTERETAV
ncbi:MAG: hypothetical protein JXM73_20290 [Anaerolineae bacterium]|nr:hypothetical protein [Anaerolineae bacterium]